MLAGSYPKSVAYGISVEKAAEKIFRGLRRNEAEIVFPAITGIFQYTLSLLPLNFAETITSYILHRQ